MRYSHGSMALVSHHQFRPRESDQFVLLRVPYDANLSLVVIPVVHSLDDGIHPLSIGELVFDVGADGTELMGYVAVDYLQSSQFTEIAHCGGIMEFHPFVLKASSLQIDDDSVGS